MEPILLIRPGFDVPWGFRLQGGIDQQLPLTVQRITSGSVASFGLIVGDEILRIGDTETNQLTYAQAMDVIKNCGDRLELYTTRTGVPSSHESFSNYSHSPYPPGNQNQNLDEMTGGHDSSYQPRSPALRTRRPIIADGTPPLQNGDQFSRHDRIASSRQRQAPVPQQVLPDASKTVQDRRPWTYAPDIQGIQEQSRRIQRRNFPQGKPTSSVPSTSHPPTVSSEGHLPLQTQEDLGQQTDIYSGSQIPSRTFQLLNPVTSPPPTHDYADTTGLARAAQRRQRRREKLQRPEPTYEHFGVNGTKKEPEFDEAAYLAGRIPIIGSDQPKPVYRTPHTIARSRFREEEQEANEKPFDERAYLAGRIPLVKGGPIDPNLFDLSEPSSSSKNPVPSDEREDENKKPFDERAYLAGRIPLVKGGPIDPNQFDVPEKKVVKRHKDLNRPRLKQPFNESAYLAGQLNLLGQTNDLPDRVARGPSNERQQPEDAKPCWYKKDDEGISEDEYSEESFLKGRISVVRRSVDRDMTRPRPEFVKIERPRYGRERATWEKTEPEADDTRGGTCSETEFDERAFLAGKWRRHLTTDKDYLTDTETNIPSKTFRILRRSVSSDKSEEELRYSSTTSSGASEDELGSDQEKAFDCYMYQGRKIPSKIFSRLKKTMDRKAAADLKAQPKDPIERLKEKSIEQIGIDVDTAIERLDIGKHDPDTYMELLKKSVEQNDMRVEPDNDVTDF